MSSLPPDQSLSITNLNERLIILSVSEEGLSIGKGTDYVDFTDAGYKNGVYLYTENLAITSDISGAQGLTISTFSLQCAKGGVIVDANGARGKDNVGVDAKEADGGDGGVLSVFVQDLSDATAKTLTLQARGGDGGDTYLSSGSVGNGGNGGTVNSVFQPTYVQLLVILDRYFNREEFHPEGTDEDVQERYNATVEIGDPIYVDAKTAISLAQVSSAEEEVINEIFKPLSNEISKIDNRETRTVLQVKIGANDTRHNLQRVIADQQGDVATRGSDVQGGNPGRGVNINVEPGQPGKNGHQTQVFLSTWGARNFADAPFPIAHPVHCSMLLERANTFYYINSPSLRAYAKLLYQRVIDRLSFLPIESVDPLYKAYTNNPIMPSTAIADLKNMKTQASNLLVQLSAGNLDYNGIRALWVPRASYTFYSGVMEDALNDLAIFEEAYIQYQEAFKKQQDLNDKLSIAYNNTSGILTSLAEDQQDLRLSIQDLDRKISAATPVVEAAREQLMEAYEAEIDVIRNSLGGLSVPQIVNALTMIAFAPNKAMTGLQVGNLVYQGFTSVPTIDGSSLNKNYLASKIEQSETSIEDIKTLLGTTIDGEYQLDDPFATRLITEKENMIALLGQFSQGAFGGVNDEEARKNLEDKFDALIDAVTTRNGFILDYNVTINLLLSKIADAATYKQKQQELIHQRVTYNNPDLPAITAYVAAIYQSSRSRVMKLMDILLRSLNFRMVITSDVYNYAFPSGNPDNVSDLDEVPLSLTALTLRNVRSNIVAKFAQQVEFWGSEPAKFPRNFDIDEGKQFRLKRFDLEELLEDDEHTACSPFFSYEKMLINLILKIVITIPKVDKYSTNAGDFEDCCNIRLYRVRFVLTGLKAYPGKIARVEFKMTHGGNETIYNRSNAAYKFEHDPVTTIFSFRLDDKGTRYILDNGNIGESDINEVATSYAAPGPFAEWTVSMKGTEWGNLDTSEVTGGYFDFCGTNYVFN